MSSLHPSTHVYLLMVRRLGAHQAARPDDVVGIALLRDAVRRFEEAWIAAGCPDCPPEVGLEPPQFMEGAPPIRVRTERVPPWSPVVEEGPSERGAVAPVASVGPTEPAEPGSLAQPEVSPAAAGPWAQTVATSAPALPASPAPPVASRPPPVAAPLPVAPGDHASAFRAPARVTRSSSAEPESEPPTRRASFPVVPAIAIAGAVGGLLVCGGLATQIEQPTATASAETPGRSVHSAPDSRLGALGLLRSLVSREEPADAAPQVEADEPEEPAAWVEDMDWEPAAREALRSADPGEGIVMVRLDGPATLWIDEQLMGAVRGDRAFPLEEGDHAVRVAGAAGTLVETVEVIEGIATMVEFSVRRR